MLQQNDSSNKWKMNGCSFHQLPLQKLGWFLYQHRKTLCLRGFILKPRERAWILLQNGTRDFQNYPPFEISACFFVTTTGSFECFHSFIFEPNFLKNENVFLKNWNTVFQFKVLRLKAQYFNTKLPCQKPMLRQIKWEVQNRPITKVGVLPVATLFF